MAERPHPKRSEVWWVKPGKTFGAELQKKRPYVVISADAMGNGPVKIVVPLKSWQDRFADWDWVVRIEPTQANGSSGSRPPTSCRSRASTPVSSLSGRAGCLPPRWATSQRRS